MKDKFAWRLMPTDEEFATLWRTAVFGFDASALLDLYRVSRSTAEDLLTVMEKIRDRIWLPYQATLEFLRNRNSVIWKEAQSFDDVKTAVKNWRNEVVSYSSLTGKLSEAGRVVPSEIGRLLVEREDLTEAVDGIVSEIEAKLESLATAHMTLNPDIDPVLERLLSLSEGRLGDAFDRKQLDEIYKEGEIRFAKQIPPGYRDRKKPDESIGYEQRKYGDLVIWKEILQYCRAHNQSFVLITGDSKNDWWEIENGKIISPCYELRREFQEETKQRFWLYQTDRFLEFAKKAVDINVRQDSIDEAAAVIARKPSDMDFGASTLRVQPHPTRNLVFDPSASLGFLSSFQTPNDDLKRLLLSMSEIKKFVDLNDWISTLRVTADSPLILTRDQQHLVGPLVFSPAGTSPGPLLQPPMQGFLERAQSESISDVESATEEPMVDKDG